MMQESQSIPTYITISR